MDWSMTNRRQLIFWLALTLLIFGAFAAEATLRNRTCISALTIDQTSTTVHYPEACVP